MAGLFTLGRSGRAARSRRPAGAVSDQLAASQHRFLQDAAHQLRTSITIALGHAEHTLAMMREKIDRSMGDVR